MLNSNLKDVKNRLSPASMRYEMPDDSGELLTDRSNAYDYNLPITKTHQANNFF